MHTEEQARKLWCPMGRSAGHFNSDVANNVSFNRDPSGKVRKSCPRCITSECTMWRWADEVGGKSNSQGYCGLGGKP